MHIGRRFISVFVANVKIGSTIMYSANIIPIPKPMSLTWPRASALSLLGQHEIAKYDQKKSRKPWISHT